MALLTRFTILTWYGKVGEQVCLHPIGRLLRCGFVIRVRFVVLPLLTMLVLPFLRIVLVLFNLDLRLLSLLILLVLRGIRFIGTRIRSIEVAHFRLLRTLALHNIKKPHWTSLPF